MTEKLLSVPELADLLGVPEKTLYAWSTRWQGPPAIRVGRYLRYDPKDVAAWLASQRQDARA